MKGEWWMIWRAVDDMKGEWNDDMEGEWNDDMEGEWNDDMEGEWWMMIWRGSGG